MQFGLYFECSQQQDGHPAQLDQDCHVQNEHLYQRQLNHRISPVSKASSSSINFMHDVVLTPLVVFL